MDFTEQELGEFLGVGAQEQDPDNVSKSDTSGAGSKGVERSEGQGTAIGLQGGAAARVIEPDGGATARAAHAPPMSESDTPGADSKGVEEAGSQGGEGKESSDPVKNASEQSQAAIQSAVEAALAKRDAEHRKALEDMEARQKQQWADFFKSAQLQNTISGQPIQNLEEFEAWRRDFQAEKLQRNLREGKLSREDLDAVIAGNPAVIAAQEAAKAQQATAQAQQEAADQAAFQARVAEELREIHALDERVNSLEDVLKLETGEAFASAVRRGCSFIEAFKLANFDAIRQRQEEAARKAAQAAALNARSKDHLRATGSIGTGAAAVPREVMELYRQMVPKASEAEILAHYNKMLAEGQRGA